MASNTDNAIQTLLTQKKRLASLTDYKNVSWKTHTMSLIKNYLGEDSEEYKKIKEKPFSRRESQVGRYGVGYDYQIDKEFFNDYLDNCIEAIKIRGLYKKPKSNFLQSRNNFQIISMIFAAIGIAFSVGVWVGNTNAKIEFYEKNNDKNKDSGNVQKVDTTIKK